MGNVLVFVSIVIGLGVTDILVSLHRLLRAKAKVRWDWAALAVALLVLLTIVQMWWTIAQPSAKSMTIGAFLPTLVELILLFLLASAVLPDSLCEDGIDLKAYYHDNGGYIWTLFAMALGWLMATDFVVSAPRLGIPAALGRSSEEFIVLAVMISLIFIRRRWWHAVSLCVLAGGPIGWLSRSLS
jgi:hypothetical protein